MLTRKHLIWVHFQRTNLHMRLRIKLVLAGVMCRPYRPQWVLIFFFTLTCCQLIFVVIEEEFEVSFLTRKYGVTARNLNIWSIYLNCEWKVKQKKDPRSYLRNLSSCEKTAWENSGLNGIRTHDLCDACAVLYQLSYQANWELVKLRVRNMPGKDNNLDRDFPTGGMVKAAL